MPVRVSCPVCHLTFRVGDHHAGRSALCPECGALVHIPSDDLPALVPRDEPEEPGSRRRAARRPPSPRDHLPAWRRVSTGYLIQQIGGTLLLVALALILISALVLAPDRDDPNAEPELAQV